MGLRVQGVGFEDEGSGFRSEIMQGFVALYKL